MADLIERDAAHDAIGFERCDRSCTDCPTKCTWFYTVKNIPAVNRWIPCSEALPASICRVLVTTFAGNVGVAVFNPEKKRWYKNGEFYDLCLIIAWQPMPDAYEPPEREVQHD